MNITYLTKDHPEANGRKPEKGETQYTLFFPLEDGGTLYVKMGQVSYNYFASFIGQMFVDDDKEKNL